MCTSKNWKKGPHIVWSQKEKRFCLRLRNIQAIINLTNMEHILQTYRAWLAYYRQHFRRPLVFPQRPPYWLNITKADQLLSFRSSRITPFVTYLTKLLQAPDHRCNLFDDGWRKVLECPNTRRTLILEFRKDFSLNANIFSSRFFFVIKRIDDGNDFLKAYFVLSVHRNDLKFRLLPISTTLPQSSLKLTLTVYALF